MQKSGSAVETEIKLRVKDPGEARRLLEGAGFHVARGRRFERNLVLDRDGELNGAGMLLRLRQDGRRVVLTFKGPARPGDYKSREETELRLSSLEAAFQIFFSLGFRESFRYEKYRTDFVRSGAPGLATVDETPVGTFIELEGSSGWIDENAARLGFTRADYIKNSYGRLYLDECARRGTEPANMVFEIGD
jgi:adenylate cyclase, class 2